VAHVGQGRGLKMPDRRLDRPVSLSDRLKSRPPEYRAVHPGVERSGLIAPAAQIGELGRPIFGETEPGEAVPCARTSNLTPPEVDEVVGLIAAGRSSRHSVTMPERLRTRSWAAVEQVLLALDARRGLEGAGWKVGAASEKIRIAEGLPSPLPGRMYRHSVFQTGASLAPDLFINYRLCECEFAFELARDFPPREEPWRELEVEAGIESLFPAIEVGDSVFEDWYGASAYFGTALDNGGGAAFVRGPRLRDWRDVDLPDLTINLFVNGQYIKSGIGSAAMGNPVTSATWMLNWLRVRGRGTVAGEVISTGTCTGHCFVARGDSVMADFGRLGVVEVAFE
jgi:2-keto-4-pentenoate hydratase